MSIPLTIDTSKSFAVKNIIGMSLNPFIFLNKSNPFISGKFTSNNIKEMSSPFFMYSKASFPSSFSIISKPFFF